MRPPAPAASGVHEFEVPVSELRDFIDWTPFFQAWELAGQHPAILDDETVGDAARDLLADAESLLDEIDASGAIQARAVIGLFPANAVGDDIDVYEDESRTAVRARLHHLRQQFSKKGRTAQCLADLVAPADAGKADWVGGFVVTAGLGVAELVAQAESEQDDYRAILIKSIADRLAEALAEYSHAKVRREFWGYAPDESLASADFIQEAYRGIRPAPGYPACPDHTEKGTLFGLLDAERRLGVSLTESFAMTPTASVAGWYFAHPGSSYFGLGRIGRDQVEDYATRKGWSLAEAEEWLSPNLAYEPGGTP